jgi:hypothetical protein
MSALHAGVVDASSAWGLAAGIAYTRDLDWTFDPALRQGQNVRGGLALGINNEAGRLAVGASARWLSLDVPGPSGSRHLSGWTGDVGVAAAIRQARLGATLRHVVSPDAAETPRRVAVAIGWTETSFLVEANASWGLKQPEPAAGTVAATGPVYRGGIGYQVGGEGLQIRAGFAHDASRVARPPWEMVCAGLGWHTTSWALDASVSADAKGSGTWQTALTLSWAVPQQLE